MLFQILMLAVGASAAPEASLTLRSANFCLNDALPNSTKTSAIHVGGRPAVLSEIDGSHVQVLFDNGSGQVRAYRAEVPKGVTAIKLASADFTAQSGAPLALEFKDGHWREAATGKKEVKVVQVVELKSAIAPLAADLRGILLSTIEKSRPGKAVPQVDACYAGLQALLANYSLQSVLSDADRAKVKATLFPNLQRDSVGR